MERRDMIQTIKIRGLKLLHFCITIAAFIACWNLFYIDRYTTAVHIKGDFVMYTFYIVVVFLLNRTYEVYNLGYASVTDNVYGQVLSNVISAGTAYVVSLLMFMRLTNPLPLMVLCVAQGLWDTAWCWSANRIYYKLHAHKRTAVIYRAEQDLNRIKEIRFYEGKFKVEKYIDHLKNSDAEIERELDGYEAVIVSGVEVPLRDSIARYCLENGVCGYFAPSVGDVIMQGSRHMRNFSVPIMSVRRAESTPEFMFIKRAFDVVVSAVGIVVLSPVFLLTALAVKLYDRGPVFYKQIRLTQNGKQFRIIKFRSMKTDAEKDNVARLATENDDRITPVGRFIRSCRIDELPQLVNILKGDMSIVGPRPERPELAEQYKKENPAFSLRLQVKAGLTGYAQVYGRYNTSPSDKLQMDLMYINKMSAVEDLKLIVATIRILFMKESTQGVVKGQDTAIQEAKSA